MSKYIFVTGGVCSGLGKGVASASIGSLLENRGFNIRMIKIDPYINVDAGTMNPYQHGEVYVTDDGAETDLDLGNYSRFTRRPSGGTIRSRRGRSTRPSSPRSGRDDSSGGPCRSSPISPMRSRRGSSAWELWVLTEVARLQQFLKLKAQ